MPEEARWSTEGWNQLKGYPWDVSAEKKRTGQDLVSGKDAETIELPTVPTSILPPQERRMYVTRADIETFGPTDGCPGCTSIAVGGRAEVAHNNQCRLRIAELLSSSEAGRERLEQHRRKRRGAGGSTVSAGSPARPSKSMMTEELLNAPPRGQQI